MKNRISEFVAIAVLCFATGRTVHADPQYTFQQLQTLFNNGKALDPKDIPDTATVDIQFVGFDGKVVVTGGGYFFYRIPGTDSVYFAERDTSMTDEESVKHLSDCPRYMLPGTTDASLDAYVFWRGRGNYRPVAYMSDGTLMDLHQMRYLWRKVKLADSDKPAFVVREETQEVGCTLPTGYVSTLPASVFAYSITNGFRPVVPAKDVTANCDALHWPYRWMECR